MKLVDASIASPDSWVAGPVASLITSTGVAGGAPVVENVTPLSTLRNVAMRASSVGRSTMNATLGAERSLVTVPLTGSGSVSSSHEIAGSVTSSNGSGGGRSR